MARRPIRAIARKARWVRPGLQRIFRAVHLLGIGPHDQLSAPFEAQPPGEQLWASDAIFTDYARIDTPIHTSNRDTSEWLAMFDDMLLAQSAVDRVKNSAYDLVIDGESYRPRLKPKLDTDDAPPPTPVPTAKAAPPNQPHTGRTTITPNSFTGFTRVSKPGNSCLYALSL